MRVRSAFTLIEILIVVVILGILAAIAIPRFAGAAEEAQIGATSHELQKLRRQIGVYRARNSDQLPNVLEGDGTWGPLISRDYMLSPPINAWAGTNNGRVIRFGVAPDTTYTTDYGWIFNTSTGEIWAAGYDADDRPLPKN